MSAFLVLLHDEDEDENKNSFVRESITTKYPDDAHVEFSDHAFFVVGPRLVEDLANDIGLLDDEPPRRGVVLRLNGSHSGRSWRRLWDWLREADATRGFLPDG